MKDSLPSLSSFTFGTMSLTGLPESFSEDVRVARAAMEAGVWFHSSQEYSGGGSFMVLRQAFDEDRSRTPKTILKIRCDHAAVLKFDVEDALRRLGIDHIELAQLCRAKHDRRPVVDDFLAHGEMWQACRALQKEGKVGQFIMEVFASYSPDAIRAVEAGLFPAYIFYYNPGERQASNELLRLLEEKEERILSLRILCGGHLDPAGIEALRERNPQHYAIARFEELVPLFDKSGCATWLEFSLSFLRTVPRLMTSIAGTSKRKNLQALLEADAKVRPMDPGLAGEIRELHSRWMKVT